MTFTSEQIARFWAKVDKSGDCWLWTGGRFQCGYGKWRAYGAGKQWLTHRVAFLLLKGYLPEKGLVLDHLCETRLCVNPSHINVTTIALNCLRSPKLPKPGYCRKGHSYAEHGRVGSSGHRHCKICNRAWETSRLSRRRMQYKLRKEKAAC